MSRFAGTSSTARMRGGVRKVFGVPLLRQEFAHHLENLARAERLGDVAVAAGRERLGFVAGQRIRGHGDDGNMAGVGGGLYSSRGVVYIQNREAGGPVKEGGAMAGRPGGPPPRRPRPPHL